MEFGKIAEIQLKEIWPGEASDFTPWLSNNLNMLSEKLGMDLELESTEMSAGDFSADIVARDLSTNKLVVIENQYGSTDHKHLGQIITYSSVLDAGTVVWIAESIRREHKAAIDFLNQNLKETLRIYALETKVIKIDQSRPAFGFNMICAPLETPVLSKSNANEVNETKEKYRVYFQGLLDVLREKYHFTNARAGQPQNWYTFASEYSRIFKYSTSFAQNSRVRVEIYIDWGDKEKNELLFDEIMKKKELLELEFGQALNWEKLETKRACRIAIYRDGDIDSESEVLEEIKTWTVENLLKFKKMFYPIILESVSKIGLSDQG